MRPWPFSTSAALALAFAPAARAGASSAEKEGTCSNPGQDGVCTNGGSGSNTIIEINPQQPECGLYMAPSTLGEGANLGMYAGRDIAKKVDIQQEIAIPFLFRDWEGPSFFHQYPGVEGGDHDDGALWFRYIWSGWVANIETYDTTNVQANKVVFVPGIGCTINSVMDMQNVKSTTGSTYDTAGYNRSDPSAGAFCPYHSTHTVSTQAIPQGSEIFAEYGDEWIPEIPGAQITFNYVMDQAEDFLRDDYIPFVKKYGTDLKPNVLEGLYNFTRDFPHSNPKILTVLPRKAEWKEIQQQLDDFQKIEGPLIVAMLQKAAQEPSYNPKFPYYTEHTSLVRHFIRRNGKRSMDWIKENGRCCDHMTAATSTIPHAGRGAFATRELPKGTIVGYSPLVHIGSYAEKVYNVPYTEMGPKKDQSYNKTDLIYNYAFYHPNSTVMLSPYGSIVNYINHASSDLNLKANVRLSWPTTEMMAHKPDWLTKDVDFLTYTLEKIGLSFDYVALRDIREGEEVLLDYGPEFESAWKEHVNNWVPPPDADTYVHSSQWGEETLRTETELKTNPYPPNLHTVCIPAYMWNPQQNAHFFLKLEKSYVDRVKCRVLERLPDPIDPTTLPEVYTVELQMEGGPIKTHHFPRNAIYLTDQPLSQDWHLPNTFRHPIRIPDDIFPESWINLDEGDNEESEIVKEG